jgi:mannose-1-phosphate guanylyltransferase/mannose-1-phosphate guanylyltransferase/mannose-6-phosphate isomerase
MTIFPIILSGGAGSRLWPLSRSLYPKQLLALTSQNTMIQETCLRVAAQPDIAPPLVICNHEHRFLIAEQLRQINIQPSHIVLEPSGRNTAAAVAVAARMIEQQFGADSVIFIMPADHEVANKNNLLLALRSAVAATQFGGIVTFGVMPDHPETGYGYIRIGQQIDDAPNNQKTQAVFRVDRFVEKPSREIAASYVADGRYLWNSGMFVFRAGDMLLELTEHVPDTMIAIDQALKHARHDLDFWRLDPESFARAPDISIDIAVMEKTARAMVIPVDLGWTDVGSFDSLWQTLPHDDQGNAVAGDILLQDTRNSLIRSDGPLTAVIGVENIIVVVNDDAVLVAARNQAQDVKKIVEHLKKNQRPEATHRRITHRPWGWSELLQQGARYRLRRVCINPGCQIALQKHKHRTEHWVVVEGTARVTRDGQSFDVDTDQSIFIPADLLHSVENPGDTPLIIIEVQSGDHVDELDVIRLNDQEHA